jgi:hypothetical protein
MKTLKFNSKSWHYWLATRVSDFSLYNGDFCSYIRSVLWGAFVVTILTAASLFCLYALGRDIYAAYTCLFTKVCAYGKFEEAVTTAIVIVATIVVFIALCIWYQNRKDRIRDEINNGIREPSQPGFMSMAYKSVKEKTCFKVEFK